METSVADEAAAKLMVVVLCICKCRQLKVSGWKHLERMRFIARKAVEAIVVLAVTSTAAEG